jgi:hypothetical protein
LSNTNIESDGSPYEGACITAFFRSGIGIGARDVRGGYSPIEEMPL